MLPKNAKIGTNLIYLFLDPKNDHNSFRFLGIGRFFIAFALSKNGEIPVLETLNPNYLISF